jgi:hypothetical protein
MADKQQKKRFFTQTLYYKHSSCTKTAQHSDTAGRKAFRSNTLKALATAFAANTRAQLQVKS